MKRIKITMCLTEKDIKRTTELAETFGFRSKTTVVKAALIIFSTIVQIMSDNGKLIIHNADGSTEQLVLKELKHRK